MCWPTVYGCTQYMSAIDLAITIGSSGNVNSIWPHCDRLIWPHLGSFLVGSGTVGGDGQWSGTGGSGHGVAPFFLAGVRRVRRR